MEIKNQIKIIEDELIQLRRYFHENPEKSWEEMCIRDSCGIDALIVPDMPFEEREELLPACKKYDMTLIYLVAPTSRERAQAIARESDGFVYCVSSLGVTGVRSEITTNIKEMVDTVKQGRNVPCAIGFGISTPEQASKMASQADGVIVGSAIVKMIARYGINCVEPVCDYVKQMKAAVGV